MTHVHAPDVAANPNAVNGLRPVRLILIPKLSAEETAFDPGTLDAIAAKMINLPMGTIRRRVVTDSQTPRTHVIDWVDDATPAPWQVVDLISHYSDDDGLLLGVLPNSNAPIAANDCADPQDEYWISDSTRRHEFLFDLRKFIGPETTLRFLGCTTALASNNNTGSCSSFNDGPLMLLTLARKLCCTVVGTKTILGSGHFDSAGNLSASVDLTTVTATSSLESTCCNAAAENYEAYARAVQPWVAAPPIARPSRLTTLDARRELLHTGAVDQFFALFDLTTFQSGEGLLGLPVRSFTAGWGAGEGRVDVIAGGRAIRVRRPGEQATLHLLKGTNAPELWRMLDLAFGRPA